jgi:hypothetical protein
VNEHPEELLADYVEGSLGSDERVRVDQHLGTCERCREEVALATEARAALASLGDLDPPMGIPLAVRRKGRSASSRTLRWAGAAAAAAVLVAGGVIVIGDVDLGTKDATDAGGQAEQPSQLSDAPAPAAESGEAADKAESDAMSAALAAPVIPVYVQSGHDYQPERLASLARRLRDDARAALDAGIARSATDFYAAFDPSAFTPEVRQAIRCVLAEVPPTQLIVPFRIEAASFEGAAAYIAAFLQGPSPEEHYDRVVIWVVDREACSLLSLATQVL